MGIELDAYLGRASLLAGWRSELPSAVACPLSGELAMVPITHELREALAARAWWGDGRMRWAARASRNATIAYVSLYEFGERSSEKFRIWSNGRLILDGESIARLLQALRQAGLEFAPGDIHLERERGEDAAERWVAWAIVDEMAANAADPIAALAGALRFERESRELRQRVRERAALRLAERGSAAAAALTALRAALYDRDSLLLRYAAAAALAAIGPLALPVLREALSRVPAEDRWAIVDAIGSLGEAATPALPQLREVLASAGADDYIARSAARKAIESITGSA